MVSRGRRRGKGNYSLGEMWRMKIEDLTWPEEPLQDPVEARMEIPEGQTTTGNLGDPVSLKFTWKIQNFSKLTERKLYSEIFFAGGCKWHLLIFPEGNDVDYLSLYLGVPDATSLPNGWCRVVSFSLAVVNQSNNMDTVRKEEPEWGFTSLIPLSKIKHPAEGFLVNDALVVEAEVLVCSAVHCSKVDNEIEVDKFELEKPNEAVEAPSSEPTSSDAPLATELLNQTKDRPSEPIQSSADVQTISNGLLTEILSRNRTQNSSSSNGISVSAQGPNPDILQQKREALKGFFKMSLEAMQQANAFGNIEEIILALIQHSDNYWEKMILEDLLSRLAEFKEIIENATAIAGTAQARRTSLTGKTTDLDTTLEQRKEELISLKSEFSSLSEEEAKLQAEIHRVTAQKKSVSLKLEKLNQETSKDLEEWQNLGGEIKQANGEWLGAREKLALANVRWKLFMEDLGLGKLQIS